MKDFTLGEDEFNRLECDRIVRIVRIFGDQTGEFTAFDEFLEQGPSKQLDLLFGLDLELFQVLAAQVARDAHAGISMRRLDQYREAQTPGDALHILDAVDHHPVGDGYVRLLCIGLHFLTGGIKEA